MMRTLVISNYESSCLLGANLSGPHHNKMITVINGVVGRGVVQYLL